MEGEGDGSWGEGRRGIGLMGDRSDDCTGDSGTIQVGQNDLSCPGLGPTAFNDKVASFSCYLG